MNYVYKFFASGGLLFFTFLYGAESNYIDEEELIVVEEEENTRSKKNRPSTLKSPLIQVTGDRTTSFPSTQLKRRGAELKTEKKILEELERDRLRDEQARFNRLFNQKQTTETKPTPTNNNQQPVNVVSTSTKSLLKESENNVFIGLQIGQGSNLSRWTDNMRHFGSYGASIGAIDSSGFSVEGNFIYSLHQVSNISDLRYRFNVYNNSLQQNNYFNYQPDHVHQFTGLLTLKFYPLHRIKTKTLKRFMPFVGASIGYSKRVSGLNYRDKHFIGVQPAYYGTYNFDRCHYFPGHSDNSRCGKWSKKTDSIDLGLNIGADLKLGKNLSLGANLYVNVYNIHNNAKDHKRLYHPYFLWRQQRRGLYSHFHLPEQLLEETYWLIASGSVKLYF